MDGYSSYPPNEEVDIWQHCDVFMAPTNTSGGWGTYAARDFASTELLDMTPLYISMSNLSRAHTRLHKQSALDDYVYGVYRPTTSEYTSQVLFGYDMMYNHHPTAPNTQLGLGSGYSQGKYTTRKIRAGEQLFMNYGKRDGGKTWFEERGLTMLPYKDATIYSKDQLNYLRTQYCSKIYSTPGIPLFPSIDEKRLAPFGKAGLGDARAKVSIKAGERIEKSTGMLLYEPFVQGTVLAPLVFSWDSLNDRQKSVITTFANNHYDGKIPVQYQDHKTDWKQTMRRTNVYDVSILPFAGRIAMVRRVGSSPAGTSNCYMKIKMVYNQDYGSATVELELIATEDLAPGDILLLDMPKAGSTLERSLLQASLEETGHPYFFDW